MEAKFANFCWPGTERIYHRLDFEAIFGHRRDGTGLAVPIRKEADKGATEQSASAVA
jgi:hypothetical protein